MTDLTEQWKKGELQEGFYYVNDGAKVTIDYYLCGYWEWHFDSDIKQVLAPVLSYEEWKKAYECVVSENEEIITLKELLKECELWFTGIVGNMNDKNVGEHNRKLPIGNFEYIFKVFSQKINEVLK